MKTFKYKLDFSVLPQLSVGDAERREAAALGSKAVLENIIYSGCRANFPMGLTNKNSRALMRILAALDVAVTDEIQIEESDFEFMKKIFQEDDFKFEPGLTRILAQIRDALQKA